MNDHELEDTLRTTFAARAGTVTRGPGWGGTDDFGATPRHRGRARWIAPLAAAAAVLAVVGVVLGLRDSGGGSNDRTSPAGQRPIPSGMKAVDALGVEIFVPASWAVDPGACHTNGVHRPIVEPTSWLGAKCAPDLDGLSRRSVGFLNAAPSASSGSCIARLTLGGEPGCVRVMWRPVEVLTNPPETAQYSYGLSVWWPQHHVGLRTVTPTRTDGLQILKSAHAVPVDRNGCAAVNHALGRMGQFNVAGPTAVSPDGLPLPTSDLQSMSVCWYIGNRLVASALLDRGRADQIAQVVNDLPAFWSRPPGETTAPACAELARTDGVEMIMHQRIGSIALIAQLAGCGGTRIVAARTSPRLAEPILAQILASTTGIPFSDGYQTTR